MLRVEAFRAMVSAASVFKYFHRKAAVFACKRFLAGDEGGHMEVTGEIEGTEGAEDFSNACRNLVKR